MTDVLKLLFEAPPSTLVLVIVFFLLLLGRTYNKAAATAHTANAELAVKQSQLAGDLSALAMKMTSENGLLKAEIYRLKDMLEDCLNKQSERE